MMGFGDAPITRKILLVGHKIAAGPLRYSGDTYEHPDCKRTLGQLAELGVVFWLWIAPDMERTRWAGTSAVHPLQDFERTMLARGELEELRITAIVPVGLDRDALRIWLGDKWRERMCRRWQCGPMQLPEQFRSIGSQLDYTASGRKVEQERGRIVIVSS